MLFKKGSKEKYYQMIELEKNAKLVEKVKLAKEIWKEKENTVQLNAECQRRARRNVTYLNKQY